MNSHFLIYLFLVLLVSCSSKEKAVNAGATSPIYPVMAFPPGPLENKNSASVEGISQPSRAAISGKVIKLVGNFPQGLPHENIKLYKKNKIQWTFLVEINSEIDGTFKISRELMSGTYKLKINSKKYRGEKIVFLDKNPVQDISFKVQDQKL